MRDPLEAPCIFILCYLLLWSPDMYGWCGVQKVGQRDTRPFPLWSGQNGAPDLSSSLDWPHCCPVFQKYSRNKIAVYLPVPYRKWQVQLFKQFKNQWIWNVYKNKTDMSISLLCLMDIYFLIEVGLMFYYLNLKSVDMQHTSLYCCVKKFCWLKRKKGRVFFCLKRKLIFRFNSLIFSFH